MGYICTCAHAHVQMNIRFRILGMAGQIALKFGAVIRDNHLNVLHMSRVGTSACAHVRTRDAKYRPGGPAGSKIQARPGFLQSPD